MHDSLILCLSRRCVKRSDGQSPCTFNLKETHLQMVTLDLYKSCYYWSHGKENACSFRCFSIYYSILLRYAWCTIKYTYWCRILWVLTCIHSWTHHCNRGNKNIHYSSQIFMSHCNPFMLHSLSLRETFSNQFTCFLLS